MNLTRCACAAAKRGPAFPWTCFRRYVTLHSPIHCRPVSVADPHGSAASMTGTTPVLLRTAALRSAVRQRKHFGPADPLRCPGCSRCFLILLALPRQKARGRACRWGLAGSDRLPASHPPLRRLVAAMGGVRERVPAYGVNVGTRFTTRPTCRRSAASQFLRLLRWAGGWEAWDEPRSADERKPGPGQLKRYCCRMRGVIPSFFEQRWQTTNVQVVNLETQ